MALMLGIDTGGTFTDAVLITDDASAEVRSTAKAPTTHANLAIGVAEAVTKVLDVIDDPNDVGLVSVSTTLATNALVEGHGEPAALFTFGFSANELSRIGLDRAVDDDLLFTFDGGHDAHGNERSPIDLVAVEVAAKEAAQRASAFAVAAQFSVRNPAHERAAAEAIRRATSKPVTASHELSAKLDGPRRGLTAALNARLLGTIDRLIIAVQTVLAEAGVTAPLMVVRGDGSLVSADFASTRPIETILSGPAASVIGALHLAGLKDGLVADIGGTTTDVAVVANAVPAIAEGGAIVGGHRTMVEAVDMATIGLGGDSEVRIDTRHDDGPVLLGPERAIPICRLAVEHPSIVDELERQLAAPMGLTSHGRFMVLVASPEAQDRVADDRERAIIQRLIEGPRPAPEVASNGLEQRAAIRLQRRGLVRVATMTPTDATAIVGSVPSVDTRAANMVADVLARQTNATGGTIAEDGRVLARQVIHLIERRSATFLLRVALANDGVDHSNADALLDASLSGSRGAAEVAVSLTSPVVAIGAPAATYYPRVGELVRAPATIPPHAEVANAVGAVVGRVRLRRSVTITQPTRGQYRVHLEDQPTFGSVENARAHAESVLVAAALADAEAAGADTPEVTHNFEQRIAEVNGKEVFVEGLLTVEVSGRPRL